MVREGLEEFSKKDTECELQISQGSDFQMLGAEKASDRRPITSSTFGKPCSEDLRKFLGLYRGIR